MIPAICDIFAEDGLRVWSKSTEEARTHGRLYLQEDTALKISLKSGNDGNDTA